MQTSDENAVSEGGAVAVATGEPAPPAPPDRAQSGKLGRPWIIVAGIVILAVAAGVIYVVAGGIKTVKVSLTEYKVGMTQTTFQTGKVKLSIANDGKIGHELLVFRSDLTAAQYPKEDGNIAEDGPGITQVSDGEDIDPGQTQTRTVDLSTPGTYVFVCNQPGHYAAGMYTTVVVK